MSITRAFNCTEMTRVVMCDEDYYKNVALKKYAPEVYADYTVYLVNKGTASVENEDEPYPVTDLYFGSRKVTDVIPVTEYPGDDEYPDDKIYLQLKYNESIPILSGDPRKLVEGYFVSDDIGGKFYKESSHENVIVGKEGVTYIDLHTNTPYSWTSGEGFGTFSVIDGHKTVGTVSGYQMYFKHDGQTLPISSSLIADVDPIVTPQGLCKFVGITWCNVTRTDESGISEIVDDQVYTRVVTDEYLPWLFAHLPDTDAQNLADAVYKKSVKPPIEGKDGGRYYDELKSAINSDILERLAWKSIGGN